MVEVRLYGELRKEFGAVHHFDIRSPAEAFRALLANFPKFASHLATSADRGIGYKVIANKDVIAHVDDLRNPTGQSVIKIAPVVMGATSKSMTQILIGAAILAVAWWNPLGWAYAGNSMFAAGALTGAGSIMVGLGTSLILGGVAQMLAPSPPTLQANESPGNEPSYLFNGPVNTTAQGQAVPVGYGQVLIGSAVISAGVSTEESP